MLSRFSMAFAICINFCCSRGIVVGISAYCQTFRSERICVPWGASNDTRQQSFIEMAFVAPYFTFRQNFRRDNQL